MDERTKEVVRILRLKYKHADRSATEYEKGRGTNIIPMPADYWLGCMTGIILAIDLLTEEE